MKLCIPVREINGLYSHVAPHFGSAEAYLLIDTETLATDRIEKESEEHQHGRCGPVRRLRGRGVEGVVASSIGRNALGRLNEMGAKVYRTEADTVAEVLLQLRENGLAEMTAEETCHGRSDHHGS